MSQKVIIVEGEVSDNQIETIKKQFSNGERGIVIIGSSANGESRIIYPTDITEEEVWTMQVDGKSISELLKMYHALQAEKNLNVLLDGISNIQVEPMPNMVLNGYGSNSNFLPERMGGGYNPHKGGRNQKIIRR